MIKHEGVNNKETTEISTQRYILNLTGRPAVNILVAWKQERWSPGAPRVPLTKRTRGKMERLALARLSVHRETITQARDRGKQPQQLPL